MFRTLTKCFCTMKKRLHEPNSPGLGNGFCKMTFSCKTWGFFLRLQSSYSFTVGVFCFAHFLCEHLFGDGCWANFGADMLVNKPRNSNGQKEEMTMGCGCTSEILTKCTRFVEGITRHARTVLRFAGCNTFPHATARFQCGL